MALTYKTYRRAWLFLTLAYFSIGYLALNWINSNRSHYYNVGFEFESKIPFIPYFIFGYSIVYLSVFLVYFLVTDKEHFKKVIKSYLLLTTLHFFFFLLIPVKMELRPVLLPEPGMLGHIVKFYYWLDMPFNCFPSLHIAYIFLGTLALWNYKRPWGYLFLTATLLVSVSVILVKQHYILDVVTGYVTPPFVYWLCFSKKKFAR